MRAFNHRLSSIAVIILMLGFFQCANTYKLDKVAPTKFKDVYFQKWNAGIQEGGSGVNVFIKVEDESVALDSVYFRGKGTKLIVYPNNSILHIGKFTPQNNSTIPFKLKDDECVLSYSKGKKIHYFKISKIKEREILNYPSSPPNN